MILDVDIRLRQGSFQLEATFTAGDGITALFGPSGSGKSTLLAAIAGLRRCRGVIRLGSHTLTGWFPMPPHRRGVGLVFQDARLFPHLTVRENIAYAWARAPREARPAIENVVRFFDIGSQMDRMAGNLSGGEKSRVALARALASAPDFLLLDEPFAALDGTRRRTFIRVLLDMHRAYRLPMMVVTHDIEDAAALASHLLALRDGQLVADGAFAEASLRPEFRELLDARDVGAALPAARFRGAQENAGRHVWLRADQVLLAAEEPRAVSARNIVAGKVRAVTAEPDGSRLVELETGMGTILSRITPEAESELGLGPDKQAWALVKAHAV